MIGSAGRNRNIALAKTKGRWQWWSTIKRGPSIAHVDRRPKPNQRRRIGGINMDRRGIAIAINDAMWTVDRVCGSTTHIASLYCYRQKPKGQGLYIYMHATWWRYKWFLIKFQGRAKALFNAFFVYFVIQWNTKEPWASADSNEAWTRKGPGSEIYIFWSPPKAIFHIFQRFLWISKYKGKRGNRPSVTCAIDPRADPIDN